MKPLLTTFAAVRPVISRFLHDRSANIAVTFAFALVPIVVAAGAGIDYSRANSARANMQSALDSTALALIPTAASQTQSALTSNASSYFGALFNVSGVSNVQVTASYDTTSSTVTVTGSAKNQTSLLQVMGMNSLNFGGVAKAKLGGGQTWPVCVLVTDPDSSHTFLVQNQASVNFSNCLVQVNTANWDAVEAHDTSYIHSVNGVNCFTGDIHYGDITPAKQPTCAMLPDPYSSFSMPSSAATCSYTGLQVNTAGTTLNPGTYCNGLKIQANTTLNPGVYIIKNGQLTIQNAQTITASGVTFLLTGNNAGLNIDMTKYTNSSLNLTPDVGSDAGQFAGFLFFLDQTPGSDGKTHYQGQSVLKGVNMSTSGTIYLAGQQLQIQNNSNITLNTGSIVAGYILPTQSQLTLTGLLSSPQGATGLTKSMTSNTPVLTQ